MILDFTARSNNISYNIKLAKMFGVCSAIYLTLLMDCYFSREEDEYIKLSREDIYNLTGIEDAKQEDIEHNLESYNLIQVSPLKNSSLKNYYKLNVELLEHIISLNNSNIVEELQKTFKTFKAATTPPKSVSKRACIKTNLKNAIKVEDKDCREALESWIENAMQKTGYLSKQQVESMEDDLTKYAAEHRIPILELFNAAAKYAYKDSKWVIEKYSELNGGNKFVLNGLNQTEVTNNLNKLKNYNGETF